MLLAHFPGMKVFFMSLPEQPLRGEIVDQPVRVLDIGTRELRLIFDHCTSILNQPARCFLDVADSDFQNGAQRWAGLDEQVNVFPVQADYLRVLAGDCEPELLDVEGCCRCGVGGLNENVRAKVFATWSPLWLRGFTG